MTVWQEVWLSLRVTAAFGLLLGLAVLAWELLAQARGLDRLMP